MKGSLYLGKVLGIKVLVHYSFILIFLYVGYFSYDQFHSINEALYDCLITLLAFVCVLMHEYGHALAARKVGIQTRQIVILPIGGMAQLDNMPEKPKDELFVTICGPLVNLGLVILLLPVVWLNHSLATLGDAPSMDAVATIVRNNIPLTMLFINAGLLIFNLVPAFPMDGGRIFRALLATRFNYVKATLIAARTGQSIAIGVVAYFIYLDITTKFDIFSALKMIILCVFIVFLAGAEYRMVKMRYRLRAFEQLGGDREQLAVTVNREP